MPKLIIKQEIERVSWIQKHAKSLSLSGMLLLTVVVGSVVWSSMSAVHTSRASLAVDLPSLVTANNRDAEADYLRQNTELDTLIADYERRAALMPIDQAGNTDLKDAAEHILQQVFIMDDAMLAMGLGKDELEALQQRQHYLQDFWQSRVTFAELRLQRLQDLAQVNMTAVSALDGASTLSSAAEKPTGSSGHALAEPPPGMVLPPGFCSLSGPNACKPE